MFLRSSVITQSLSAGHKQKEQTERIHLDELISWVDLIRRWAHDLLCVCDLVV